MENQINQNKVIINDREQLKKYFKNRMLPNENHFAILIDSMLNKVDDGISKNDVDGLMVFPAGDEKKLLSFYEHIKEKKASWIIVNGKGESKGLIIKEEGNEWPTMYFQAEGKIGIGTLFPKQKLEVDGLIASKGRMGTFKEGKVDADGKWKDILTKLDSCEAFEIMAYAGLKDKEKYALMHAKVISTFGNSKSKISKTCAHYGFWWEWWNKISLRFIKREDEMILQIRTNRHFGNKSNITYKVSKLWDNSFFNKY